MKTLVVMKTALGAALAWWAALPACSQGTIFDRYIVFGNRIYADPRIDAPVFDTDCTTRLAGAAYLAQVYVGSSTDSLMPIGLVQPFGTGDRAGYVTPQYLRIPGAGGLRVYTQLRAWEARGGASYEEAVMAGAKYGFSNLVPMTAVTPPGAPLEPVGLQSFCLVPEPPSEVLLALGEVALLALAPRQRRPTPGP